MACIQVLSEDGCVPFAGSQGNVELNAMGPIIINNVLHSVRILGDACTELRSTASRAPNWTGRRSLATCRTASCW